jgi:outer membrane protein OmpA-like peptidoglycan-associated protein
VEEQKPVTPPPIQVPALPTAGGSAAASSSVMFEKDKTDLSDAAKAELNSLAEKIKTSQGRVQIVAYASGTADQSSVARRISLSRALQIRAFLIDKGVNELSISVQSQGNKVPSGNADRADVTVR